MAPLSVDTVRQLIDGYAELLAEHEETAALLSRLSPALIELRNVLNELSGGSSRTLGSGSGREDDCRRKAD